jgi:hypothetical protein
MLTREPECKRPVLRERLRERKYENGNWSKLFKGGLS